MKTKENKSLKNFAEAISGEKALRDKEQKLREKKKKAVLDEKDRRRRNIVEGFETVETEEVQKKDVVQNIKLFEWKAPERHNIKLNSKGFLLLIFLILLFIVLLAILGHYFMIAALVSLIFILYAAATTKPLVVEHKITARGIDTAGKLYEWYMLDSFYFAKKEEYTTVIVTTKLNFPRLLIMLVNKKDKDPLFVLLQKNLLYEEIRKQGKIDEISYGKYIPLEEI